MNNPPCSDVEYVLDKIQNHIAELRSYLEELEAAIIKLEDLNLKEMPLLLIDLKHKTANDIARYSSFAREIKDEHNLH